MKTLIAIIIACFSFSISAQTTRKPTDGTKQTDKSALEMTTLKKSSPEEITPNDRSAAANGSLTVENSTKKRVNPKQKRQIPDGTYGTINSGMPYSIENPNYPYDRDGKLIQNEGAEIITRTNGKAAQTGTIESTKREKAK